MKKRVFIILGAIVCVILVLSLMWMFKRKNNAPQQNQENISVNEAQITEVDDYTGKLSDGSKINTNAKMNQPMTLGNLQVDNVRLTLKNGITTFRANVTNNGDSKTELKNVKVILLNENGEELVSVNGIIPELEKGNSQELAVSVTSDYLKASGYKIVEE